MTIAAQQEIVRLGILGCASVSSFAIIDPVRRGARLALAAVASRDSTRAAAYAQDHGFARSYGRYEDLLADPEIDAIYIPLPNALHKDWAIAAMRASYPVLCEKPLALNAAEARQMVEVSEETASPLVEAFHWRTHPQAQRIMQILNDGTIGVLREIEMVFTVPAEWIPDGDIRYDRALGGGAFMDLGCYCVDLTRQIARAKVSDVSATPTLAASGVDSGMDVTLTFETGLVAQLSCSMATMSPMEQWISIKGDKGEMRVRCPISPSGGGEIAVRAGQTSFVEAADLTPSWYFQANYFSDIVLKKTEPLWPARDAVENMDVIDRVYRAAGIDPAS